MANLQVGQKVHCILYGGRDGIIYKIVGEQTPETIKTLGGGVCVMGGSANIYVVFSDGSMGPVPESIVHGVQWRIYNHFATEKEIEAALKFAADTEDRKRREEESRKLRREKERDQFIKEYPYLIKVQDSNRYSGVIGAKNLKKELSLKFPGVKFSVRSDGSSIDIHWVDGPSKDEIENISFKYKEGYVNGVEDIYEYNRDNVWPNVFGGAQYLSLDRKYSREVQQQIADELEIKISFNQNGHINFEDSIDSRKFHEVSIKKSFYIALEPKKKFIAKVEKLKPSKENDDQSSASKKQLWILHCITKLDTREWKLSYQQAYDLISKANQGVNIKDMVKDFIAC